MPHVAAGSPLLEGGSTVDALLFSIKLPRGWLLRDDPIVPVHAAPTGAALFPNLKVAVLRPPAPGGAENVVQATREAYREIWTVHEDDADQVAGLPARRLVLLQDIPGAISKQVKYFVEAGARVIIITGQSTPEDFQVHEPVFEAIAESLQLTAEARQPPP